MVGWQQPGAQRPGVHDVHCVRDVHRVHTQPRASSSAVYNRHEFSQEDVMAVTPPFVECDQLHPNLAVDDISSAVEFYTKKLGFVGAFTWGDPPTLAGVNL